MPLATPPTAAGSLSDFPAIAMPAELHRVWRYHVAEGTIRTSPWWFASAPTGTGIGGRFDLPPDVGGTCYLATSAVAATLEALQAHLALLPVAELEVRRRVSVSVSADAPPAADATAPAATGTGVTVGLWGDADRTVTQAWATAFRRDGWWALHAGVAHDVTAKDRAVALFDASGDHAPTHAGGWEFQGPFRLDDDTDLIAALDARGVRPVGRPNLPAAPDPP